MPLLASWRGLRLTATSGCGCAASAAVSTIGKTRFPYSYAPMSMALPLVPRASWFRDARTETPAIGFGKARCQGRFLCRCTASLARGAHRKPVTLTKPGSPLCALTKLLVRSAALWFDTVPPFQKMLLVAFAGVVVASDTNVPEPLVFRKVLLTTYKWSRNQTGRTLPQTRASPDFGWSHSVR